MKRVGDFFYRFYFTRFVWLIKLWYTLTMLLSRRKDHVIPQYTDVRSILEALGFGMKYRADPPTFDYMSHPTRVQRLIDRGERVGDCDDHASYTATALLKSNLVRCAWIGFIAYRDAQGELKGHALTVYDTIYDSIFWLDYNLPRKIESQWDWVKHFEENGCEVLAANMIHVSHVDKNDRPVFGGHSSRKFK